MDIYVISMNSTEHFSIAHSESQYVDSIREVYLFDRDKSNGEDEYDLLFAYVKVCFKPEAEDLPMMQRQMIQQKYSMTWEDIEWDIGEMDNLIDHPEQYPFGEISSIHVGEVKIEIDFDGSDMDAEGTTLMEMLRTFYQVNPPF